MSDLNIHALNRTIDALTNFTNSGEGIANFNSCVIMSAAYIHKEVMDTTMGDGPAHRWLRREYDDGPAERLHYDTLLYAMALAHEKAYLESRCPDGWSTCIPVIKETLPALLAVAMARHESAWDVHREHLRPLMNTFTSILIPVYEKHSGNH